MIYCFDIDGTLCSNTDGAYDEARPYPDVISRINGLHDDGHRIILYTARGWTTGVDWRSLTEAQLSAWGVKYHELYFGKPGADLYIDDKAVSAGDWAHGSPDPRAGESAVPRTVTHQSVLQDAAYLDVTYSPLRAPYGEYPSQLAGWLRTHVFGRQGRLLDLGCGRGEHLAAFARLGFDVAGVDISPRAAELAQGYDVTVSDLEQDVLPFVSEFDFVFSKSVIEHMRHPERLLIQAWRALRPGGVAAIMTPSWEHTYWGPFYIDYTHVTPFTVPSLADALAIAGFTRAAVSPFYQLPVAWRLPFIKPALRLLAAVPLPYRPYRAAAPWPDPINKLIRFSKEVMLLGVGTKPDAGGA